MSDEAFIHKGWTLTIYGVKVPEVRSFVIKSIDGYSADVQFTVNGRVTIDSDGNIEII